MNIPLWIIYSMISLVASYVIDHLKSMISVKPVGVFGRFWAVAYLRTGASPNEVPAICAWIIHLKDFRSQIIIFF